MCVSFHKQCVLLSMVIIGLLSFGSEAKSYESKCDIAQTQATLKSLRIDPGPVDGLWGPGTENAIIQFQRRENLIESHALDEATCSALNETRESGEANEAEIAKHIKVWQEDLARNRRQRKVALNWSQLPDCRYLATRELSNRLVYAQGYTSPLCETEGPKCFSVGDGEFYGTTELATGVQRGAPYDYMGVGTYLKIISPVELCGLLFVRGGITVAREGFVPDEGTVIKPR